MRSLESGWAPGPATARCPSRALAGRRRIGGATVRARAGPRSSERRAHHHEPGALEATPRGRCPRCAVAGSRCPAAVVLAGQAGLEVEQVGHARRTAPSRVQDVGVALPGAAAPPRRPRRSGAATPAGSDRRSASASDRAGHAAGRAIQRRALGVVLDVGWLEAAPGDPGRRAPTTPCSTSSRARGRSRCARRGARRRRRSRRRRRRPARHADERTPGLGIERQDGGTTIRTGSQLAPATSRGRPALGAPAGARQPSRRARHRAAPARRRRGSAGGARRSWTAGTCTPSERRAQPGPASSLRRRRRATSRSPRSRRHALRSE